MNRVSRGFCTMSWTRCIVVLCGCVSLLYGDGDGLELGNAETCPPRTPASVMATEKILKLAFQYTLPTKQPRPTMKKCVEVLWAIRKDFRDKQEARNVSASPHSDGLLEKNKRKKSLGIMEEDSYSFMSA